MDTSASQHNQKRADYIVNHYSKSDIIALARDLDKYEQGYIQALKNLREGVGNALNTNIVDYIDAVLEDYEFNTNCPDCKSELKINSKNKSVKFLKHNI